MGQLPFASAQHTHLNVDGHLEMGGAIISSVNKKSQRLIIGYGPRTTGVVLGRHPL